MSERKSELVALHGGCDWADASAEYLVIPLDVDLDEAWEEHRGWYKNTYIPSFRGKRQPKLKYQTFEEWLREHHGARYVTEADIHIREEL